MFDRLSQAYHPCQAPLEDSSLPSNPLTTTKSFVCQPDIERGIWLDQHGLFGKQPWKEFGTLYPVLSATPAIPADLEDANCDPYI